MPDGNKRHRVFISAAEPSADAHCAALIGSLMRGGRNLELVGVGGPRMASAGCKLLEFTAGRAAMTYKAFAEVAHFYGLIRRIRRLFEREIFDLVVVCDSPAFNFHIAKAAKKSGSKVVFYVAPQLWAWAGWRIGKLRRYCDKLCCILPFEENWFGARGIDAVFVGHPLLDGLAKDLVGYCRSYDFFEPGHARIGLMPGSRRAEVNSLWPTMQQIAVGLQQKYPDAVFTVVAVNGEVERVLRASQLMDLRCDYRIGSVYQTALSSDLSLVASGSATLQVAAAGCPMVIMYQSSKILWHLVGRWLVKTRYLSLVNILAGRELVPEFMPFFSSIDPILRAADQLLESRERLRHTSRALVRLVEPLAGKNAADRVARIVSEMIDL